METDTSAPKTLRQHPIAGDLQAITKSLGLVFGDIGTSPIYTLTVIFLLLKPTVDNVMGVLSLVVWTLIILVSRYAWLAMSLGEKGEGGTIRLQGHTDPSSQNWQGCGIYHHTNLYWYIPSCGRWSDHPRHQYPSALLRAYC